MKPYYGQDRAIFPSWRQVVVYRGHGVVLHREHTPGRSMVCMGTAESLWDVDEEGLHRNVSGNNISADTAEAEAYFERWREQLVRAFAPREEGSML